MNGETSKIEEKLESFLWTPGDPRTVWDIGESKIPYQKRGEMIVLPKLERFLELDEDTLSRELVTHCMILRDLTKKIPSRIDIDAPIGYGKSTLTSLLYSIINARTFYEVTDSIPLELFAHDTKTYGVPFQLFAIDYRGEKLFDEMKKLKSRGYSTLSDKAQLAEKMFFRILKKYELIDEEQFNGLNKVLMNRIGKSGHPDLVIRLEGDPKLGYQRSIKRGRDYEVSQTHKILSGEEKEDIVKIREEFSNLVKKFMPEYYETYTKLQDAVGVPSRLKQGRVTPEYETDLNNEYQNHFESDLEASGFNGAYGVVNINNFKRTQEHLLAIANMIKYGLILHHTRNGFKIIEDRKKGRVKVYSP